MEGLSVTWRIIEGDAAERLRDLPAESVQCCVTSPPYFGLRDYGYERQLGLEATPDEYVARLVGAFREVRRVLRGDGTVWLNLGDSYASDDKWGGSSGGKHATALHGGTGIGRGRRRTGLKSKNLIGIPWRVAFALQADGWWLRSDIIWAKPNPMPESVTDRPTRSHEYVFLLSKSARYFYNGDAVRELDGGVPSGHGERRLDLAGERGLVNRHRAYHFPWKPGGGRNKRSVWTIASQPYPGAHFAVFPPKLIEPCILAGSREGDTVLDPFCGAGTTVLVALRHGRSFVGIELNPEYVTLAHRRICDDAPSFNQVTQTKEPLMAEQIRLDVGGKPATTLKVSFSAPGDRAEIEGLEHVGKGDDVVLRVRCRVTDAGATDKYDAHGTVNETVAKVKLRVDEAKVLLTEEGAWQISYEEPDEQIPGQTAISDEDIADARAQLEGDEPTIEALQERESEALDRQEAMA